jgi:hypothetical protein
LQLLSKKEKVRKNSNIQFELQVGGESISKRTVDGETQDRGRVNFVNQ